MLHARIELWSQHFTLHVSFFRVSEWSHSLLQGSGLGCATAVPFRMLCLRFRKHFIVKGLPFPKIVCSSAHIYMTYSSQLPVEFEGIRRVNSFSVCSLSLATSSPFCVWLAAPFFQVFRFATPHFFRAWGANCRCFGGI